MRKLLVCFILASPLHLMAQDTIINSYSEWQYYQGEKLPLESLFLPEDNLHLWKTGVSPFGDTNMDEATGIECYNNEQEGWMTYFTKSFFLSDPFEKLAYELRLRRDDGAIVFINGHEFWRSNVGHGENLNRLTALEPVHEEEGMEYFSKVFPPENFRNGVNNISVILYTWEHYNGTCAFDLHFIEHSNVLAVPRLLKWIDEETLILKTRLTGMMYQEKLNAKQNELDILTYAHKFNRTFFSVAIVLVISSFLLWVGFLMRLARRKEELINNLKSTVEQKQQELLNNSIFKIRGNQRCEEATYDLQKYIDNNTHSIGHIKRIITRLSPSMNQEDDWKNMEAQFNEVNSNFLMNLKDKFPKLTSTELRHCIFIKLMLPTKEIAEMMNIEPRSVQATRYRIKKKLELSEDMDLNEFLFRLGKQ